MAPSYRLSLLAVLLLNSLVLTVGLAASSEVTSAAPAPASAALSVTPVAEPAYREMSALRASRSRALYAPHPRASRSARPHHPPVPKVTIHFPLSALKAYAYARVGSAVQFDCLDRLWTHESGWSVSSANPSGAYGIPQALPGRKMASAGADWRTNGKTQIRWGLGYIADRYGTPCGAWAHYRSHHWY